MGSWSADSRFFHFSDLSVGVGEGNESASTRSLSSLKFSCRASRQKDDKSGPEPGLRKRWTLRRNLTIKIFILRERKRTIYYRREEKEKAKLEKTAVCQSVRVMYRGSPNHYTGSGLNRPRKWEKRKNVFVKAFWKVGHLKWFLDVSIYRGLLTDNTQNLLWERVKKKALVQLIVTKGHPLKVFMFATSENVDMRKAILTVFFLILSMHF